MVQFKPPKRVKEKEIRFLDMTIVVDTREQLPWRFHDIRNTTTKTIKGVKHSTTETLLPKIVEKKLDTGDYSLDGFENAICIERKSSSDLIGSVSSGRQRFEREHERMVDIVNRGGAAIVVIESPLHEVMAEIDSRDGRFQSSSLFKTYISWNICHRVNWQFCDNRSEAEKRAFWFLFYAHRHLSGDGQNGV